MVLYALPSILAVFPQETAHLLRAIAQHSASQLMREAARERQLSGADSLGETKRNDDDVRTSHGKIGALTSEGLLGFVSVLKTARKMGLIEAAHLEGMKSLSPAIGAVDTNTDSRKKRRKLKKQSKIEEGQETDMEVEKTQATPAPVASEEDLSPLPIPLLIWIALGHSDEELRTDAVDLVSVGKKTIENPTPFELDMMKHFLWINIKTSSPALRQTAISSIGKFLQRLKAQYSLMPNMLLLCFALDFNLFSPIRTACTQNKSRHTK